MRNEQKYVFYYIHYKVCVLLKFNNMEARCLDSKML